MLHLTIDQLIISKSVMSCVDFHPSFKSGGCLQLPSMGPLRIESVSFRTNKPGVGCLYSVFFSCNNPNCRCRLMSEGRILHLEIVDSMGLSEYGKLPVFVYSSSKSSLITPNASEIKAFGVQTEYKHITRKAVVALSEQVGRLK